MAPRDGSRPTTSWVEANFSIGFPLVRESRTRRGRGNRSRGCWKPPRRERTHLTTRASGVEGPRRSGREASSEIPPSPHGERPASQYAAPLPLSICTWMVDRGERRPTQIRFETLIPSPSVHSFMWYVKQRFRGELWGVVGTALVHGQTTTWGIVPPWLSARGKQRPRDGWGVRHPGPAGRRKQH
jgi:hypothetical protein